MGMVTMRQILQSLKEIHGTLVEVDIRILIEKCQYVLKAHNDS